MYLPNHAPCVKTASYQLIKPIRFGNGRVASCAIREISANVRGLSITYRQLRLRCTYLFSFKCFTFSPSFFVNNLFNSFKYVFYFYDGDIGNNTFFIYGSNLNFKIEASLSLSKLPSFGYLSSVQSHVSQVVLDDRNLLYS